MTSDERLRNAAYVAVVIVDSDVGGDHRVQLSIRESKKPVVLVDIRQSGNWADWVSAVIEGVPLCLRIVLWPCRRRLMLMERLGTRVDRRWVSGLPASLGLAMKALVASIRIRRMLNEAGGDVSLHAHDLYCGVAAAIAKGRRDLPLVYDAHELEIHRNRRAGWVRVLLEHGLEQFVLDRSTELKTVNSAIRAVMSEWYRLPRNVRVVSNDFYPHKCAAMPSSQAAPAIVYVGQGVNGRELESLDLPSVTALFQVHVFLIGTALPVHIQARGWWMGPSNYEGELVALARERRCMMWCCLERRCLSYELATPNKFFQALAIGVPIIASQGTYLSEVVRAQDIGMVFDGENLPTIRQVVVGEKYEIWVKNIIRFREQIRTGKLVI